MAIYLKNKDLYEQLCISKEQDKLTPECEKMLMLLAENLIRKFHYKNYEDRQDCLQNAYFVLFLRWRSFNPEFKNAFAFCTQIAKTAIANQYNKINQRDSKTGEKPIITNFSRLFEKEVRL